MKFIVEPLKRFFIVRHLTVGIYVKEITRTFADLNVLPEQVF